ncbi:DMT family transporter [Thalassovita sp.]|uniref:DMT family transporter n=1 Tax=Thalassovita sp. TaxID=1979401 RepID=UPI0029DE8A17|nr:DMT family transporter [Thalassovita sp.]
MEIQIVLLAVASAVLMALGIVLSRFGLRGMGPLQGGSVSVPTSAVMFLLLSPLTVDFDNWTPNGVAIFAAAGLIYPAAVTILNFVSNQRLGPNLTAAAGNLTPLFAIGLAILTLDEWPRQMQGLGIVVVVVGLFLVTSAQVRHFPRAHLWLLAVPVLGAFLRGAAQPLVKLGLQDWPNAFAASLIGYCVSTLVIWTFRLLRRRASPPDRKARRWFMAVGVANGLALLTLYAALARGSVTVVAPIVASYPLITMGLAWLLHGREPLSPRTIAGMGISVLGVSLVLLG